MNKDQFTGLLRELLTAVGAALVTWGTLNDGLWQTISGAIMTALMIAWAVYWNEGREMLYTLVRKLISSVAGVVVATGVLTPERADVLVGVAMSVVSLAWAIYAKGGGLPPGSTPVLAFAACLLCSSCSMPLRITDDRCVLGGYERDNQVFWSGPCVDENGKVDRLVIQWLNEEGRFIEATVYGDARKTRFRYQESNGWIEWSAKSGISLGQVPSVVTSAAVPVPVAVPVLSTP